MSNILEHDKIQSDTADLENKILYILLLCILTLVGILLKFLQQKFNQVQIQQNLQSSNTRLTKLEGLLLAIQEPLQEQLSLKRSISDYQLNKKNNKDGIEIDDKKSQ